MFNKVGNKIYCEIISKTMPNLGSGSLTGVYFLHMIKGTFSHHTPQMLLFYPSRPGDTLRYQMQETPTDKAKMDSEVSLHAGHDNCIYCLISFL